MKYTFTQALLTRRRDLTLLKSALMLPANQESRKKVAEADVHVWRASTVQTLAGSPQARENILTTHREYVTRALLPFCMRLIKVQLRDTDIDELTAIVQFFANLSIELWSQKTDIQYHCLEAFKKHVFHHADEHMELARAVGVEDGDKSLDGQPIPVVVQPLIVGFGTHDGKDYNKGKVWSKAVVRVRKDREPETSTDASGIRAGHEDQGEGILGGCVRKIGNFFTGN